MANIIPTNLSSQMKEDYLAYSMAVLLGRAIPDLYDGMKPVQRRVLQTMLEENLKPDGRYVKCARVTGLTMAYYHPHGGAYGALVNMSTPWSNNVTWIDGHGNFGSSVDGPAAERYTECKLRTSAVDLLLQDKATWETTPNYDGSRKEAVRFNTAVPSVLLNGDSGIAVGFATRLAPHNLRDVIKATQVACKFSWGDKESKTNLEKARKLLVPDFPTGCDIVKDEQLEEYTRSGAGSIRCRARMETSEQKREGKAKNRAIITFTNLPPGVNPEKLGEQVRDALEKGRIQNVAEVIDESDLTGDRVSIVAKPGTDVELLTKQLYAYTDLDTRYSAKTLVIDGTKPVELSPIEICQRWFSWRMDCLERKFRYEYKLAEDRHHIVLGLLKAIDKMDLIIKKIRESKDKTAAKVALMGGTIKLTAAQAEAVLEMRLRQLTGLDREELKKESDELEERLDDLDDLIREPTSRAVRLYKQMDEMSKRHGNARNSQLIDPPAVYTVEKVASGPAPVRVAKPRFLKIDQKKGVIEQAKGPRGAMVIDPKEKLIAMTEDGMLRKLPAGYKGPISSSFSAVTLAKREVEVADKKYLVVFNIEDEVRAMVLFGEDLCRTTSTGKKWLPEGATLLYFGEGTYTIQWSSRRKKPTVLDLKTKQGRPGARGTKVANTKDIA
jgi:DNA gyrase subunit A